jgi:glycosyltransferase involved in cell wall biosynthesis
LRVKHNVQKESWPVVGVIARYLELKGIQFIIPAFQKLLDDFPRAHLVLANAHGDFEKPIKNLLGKLPSGSYTEILFENDLVSLYKLFNIYVHTPINMQEEAFGQTYVEALAAGVPSVFSLSGVAPEFIVDKTNALVVPYANPAAIEQGIRQIANDANLRDSLIEQGLISARLFSLDNMIFRLEALYA